MIILSCLGFPALAEDTDASSVYQITDVAVDITADTAAHARDQAVVKAQRSALEQLLTRLGSDTSIAGKQSDDDIATLVQAFEVQQERTSSVRYIGTFTVQFKPNSVRNLLNKSGSNYSEARSRPIVVLPISTYNGRQILWEDSTKWRSAWDDAAKGSGLVPLIIPSGDLEDIAILSTAEAIKGKPEAMQAMIEKYQAGSALVAILKSDPDHPTAGQPLEIEAIKYDAYGKASEPMKIDPTAATDKSALSQIVRQIRDKLEGGWKQSAKVSKGPSSHLPVNVPIDSLPAWMAIKKKLGNSPMVNKINTIVLTRGEAKIELEFNGNISDLVTALDQEGLTLEQMEPSRAWYLRIN
ncbi:MAG: DUF2066 domain-containing protein [Alphaproteobacteria bacterium]|nr:DUF2066 domain-containing protein [Alphaproteobacteria bacterium]